MAELVSIHSIREDKLKNGNNDLETGIHVSIENAAYTNDIEMATRSSGATKKNGEVYNDGFVHGTTISFHDLKYTVELKVKREKIKKEIVKGIR